MRPAVPPAWRGAIADVRPLVGFRLAGLRGRRRRGALGAAAVVVVITLTAAIAPAFTPGEGAGEIVVLLPTAFLAFLVTTTLAITVAAGGRELLPRGEGVAFPVSPTTDHLGALLLAPLNVAWLLQAWTLLGVMAYVVGPHGLWAVQTTVAVWLVAATATAQLLAWCVERVRRGRHGLVLVRSLTTLLVLGAAGLVLSHQVTAVLDQSPTLEVVLVAINGSGGDWSYWLVGTALILLGGLLATVLGAWVAHAVARRQPREQLRGEGRVVATRRTPRSAMSALLRADRASVWRSVPLRRGLVTLAVLPAAVTATGQVEWHLLPILPGVVVSGGALLFGVNAWCLDGTGALWRDSLPAHPDTVFAARARVLAEVLVVAALLPLLVAGLRIGEPPTSAELVSLAAAVLVVSLQVVARSMHWSVRRPYATDLRSARAAPAPPLAMVTYSAYLSLTSTLTGLLFVLTARAGTPTPALLVALPLALLALRRLFATAGEWDTPASRAKVIATVVAQ